MFGSTATGVPRTAPTPGRSAVAPGGGRQGAEDEGGTAVDGPLVGTGRCAHPPSEPIVRRSMRPRWPGTYRAIGRIYGGDPPFSGSAVFYVLPICMSSSSYPGDARYVSWCDRCSAATLRCGL